jgi:hypothetical protein
MGTRGALAGRDGGIESMDSPALQKCLERFENAKAALQRLESSLDLKETASAWSDLIMAACSLFSKLQQAAKTAGGGAKSWFDRVKNERDTDTLLSYIHHARNADYHGLEDITRIANRQATMRIQEPFDPKKLDGVKVTIGMDSTGAPEIRVSDGAPISVEHYKQPTVVLVEIKDKRNKISYPTPSTHLGKQLEDTRPLAVGRLTVSYLASVMDEARRNGV